MNDWLRPRRWQIFIVLFLTEQSSVDGDFTRIFVCARLRPPEQSTRFYKGNSDIIVPNVNTSWGGSPDCLCVCVYIYLIMWYVRCTSEQKMFSAASPWAVKLKRMHSLQTEVGKNLLKSCISAMINLIFFFPAVPGPKYKLWLLSFIYIYINKQQKPHTDT